MERMKELIKILNEASYAYYQKDMQVMSDMEYDRLYDELKELEEQEGLILAGSPTQRVGYTVLSNLEKVRHGKQMLSLDKTKEAEKLISFLGDKEGLLSWKLDGLTIVLRYADGVFVQAVTRGNGEIGEDVTHNAKVFANVPLQIKYKGDLLVRGEAVIKFADFEKINEGLEDKYKNPRNLCSGTVRQLNSEIVAGRRVNYMAFSVINVGDIDFGGLKSNQIKWLSELGFDAVDHKLVTADTVVEALEEFRSATDKQPFATDGLVLTYDSIGYSESLGATSKFPRDSIAFKWADELAETELLEIQWNTSRTGLINPVAVFEPVELEGTTVNKASLHNVSIIESLELGIGDRITVYKANMIIPQVAENLTRSNSAVLDTIPKHCPVCGFESEIVQVKEGRALYCKNPNCKAQLVSGLTHFTSRNAMNIEGLSEATIEKFVERGFLENYADIFELEKYRDDIVTMEGFGEKSFANLMEAIKNSKNIELPNFIYALGINQVGLSNAKLLCANFEYDIEKIQKATDEELLAIDGFGEITANSLVKYFSDDKNLELLNKVIGLLNIKKPERGIQKLSGLQFVITGDLEAFENRKALQDYIEALGGKVSGSVSSKTSYLINNDVYSASSKNKKAKSLNITILSEKDFMELFSDE